MLSSKRHAQTVLVALKSNARLASSSTPHLRKNLSILAGRNNNHVRTQSNVHYGGIFCRKAGTKTSVVLEELPQGILPLENLPPEDDTPSYPTVILQARANMLKFDKCVLLTRVGGFYELYLDQAEEFGPLLNLKVAQKKTNAGPVSMVCYVPTFFVP